MPGRKAGPKGFPRANNPGGLKLTKKDVVHRELAAAIRLFLTGGDPVAIYVLVSAASAILQALGKAKAHETWRMKFLEMIKDEYRDDVTFLIDEPFNFMKHGTRDPDAELASFNPEINHVLILLLCRDYGFIFGETFPEATIYLAVMATLHPALIIDPNDEKFIRMIEPVRGLAGTTNLDLSAGARAIASFDEAIATAGRLGITLDQRT